MTLREQQSLFVSLIAQWIAWVYAAGYELTFSEAYRTPEQAALDAQHHTGIAASLHCERLAIDFNLFKDGVYLTSTEDWTIPGEHWESMHALARWGGRFNDGNHLSLEYGGIK